jgi:hypothetical protein
LSVEAQLRNETKVQRKCRLAAEEKKKEKMRERRRKGGWIESRESGEEEREWREGE